MIVNNAKAIFLDRDGTINKEVSYLHNPVDFSFIPGVVDAIKTFHDLGYLIIVITNQSGVARGYYCERDIIQLHNYIDEQLRIIGQKESTRSGVELGNLINNGYSIDAYYYCPHHPEGIIKKYAINCSCRKPNAGMIERALYEFRKKGICINLSDSFMIGDKETDMQAGEKAKIGKKILIRSGHKVDEMNTIADMICDNLFEFAQILKFNSR